MLSSIARGGTGGQWRRVYDIPDPAAGAVIQFAVPFGRCWEILSVATIFTADATVLNRDPVFTLFDADFNSLVDIPLTAHITGGQSFGITWAAGLGEAIVGPGVNVAIPLPSPLYAFPSDSIQVSGPGAAGDTLTTTRLVVLEARPGEPAQQEVLEHRIVEHAEALYELTH